jgi:hypothetical protein
MILNHWTWMILIRNSVRLLPDLRKLETNSEMYSRKSLSMKIWSVSFQCTAVMNPLRLRDSGRVQNILS